MNMEVDMEVEVVVEVAVEVVQVGIGGRRGCGREGGDKPLL